MYIPVVWLLLTSTTLGALATKFKTSLRETIPNVVPIVQNSVPVDNHRSFKKIFTRDEVQTSKRPTTRPLGLDAHWWYDFDKLRKRNIRMKQDDKLVTLEDQTTTTKKNRSRENVDAHKATRNKTNSRLEKILLSRSQKRSYFDIVEQFYTRDQGKHAHYGHKYRQQNEEEAGDVSVENESDGVGVDAADGRDGGYVGDGGDVGDGGEEGDDNEIDAEQKEEEVNTGNNKNNEDGADNKPEESNNDSFNDLDNNEDTNNHKTNNNNHEDDITQHRNQGAGAKFNDNYFFISQSEEVPPVDNNIKPREKKNAQESTHNESDLKTTNSRGQNRDKGGKNDSDDDDDDDFDLQNYYDPGMPTLRPKQETNPKPPAAVHGSYGPGGGIGSIGSISNMLHSGVMHNQWINPPPRQKKRGKLKGKNRGRGRHQRLNAPVEQPQAKHKPSHTKTKKLSGKVKSGSRLCVLNTYSEYCIGAGGGEDREAPPRAPRQRPEDPYKPVTVPGFIPKDEYNKKQKDKLPGHDTHTLILKL